MQEVNTMFWLGVAVNDNNAGKALELERSVGYRQVPESTVSSFHFWLGREGDQE